MSWKQKFEGYEKRFGKHAQINWVPVIDLTKNAIEKNPNNVEVYIRSIYMLHNILVEEEYPHDEHDRMAILLEKYFKKSYKKFSENPEYLFFIGKILHIAEWYFGINEGVKSVEQTLAFKMQKKAYKKQPKNVLFEWSYRFSMPGDPIADYLAYRIFTNVTSKINWLKSKGFPGNYILEQLKMSKENYLKKKINEM